MSAARPSVASGASGMLEFLSPQGEPYVLNLFVIGTTQRSARAIVNVRAICEQYLRGRYTLNIFDVAQNPAIAKREQVVAVPMLVREQPSPVRRFVGDMSDRQRLLEGLNLAD